MAEEKKTGVVYVLTNEAMPGWVKIGYADDLERRITQLSSKTAVPYSFRAYAYYETPYRLVDNDVRELIDIINPDLRAVEIVNGKKRKREFYKMTPEKAHQILCALAKFHHAPQPIRVQDNVPLPTRSTPKTEKQETNTEPKKEEVKGKRVSKENFSFSKCGIAVGEPLTFYKNPSIIAYVADDSKVSYEGQIYSTTALAQKVLNDYRAIQGPKCWKYKGEQLTKIRERMEKDGTYK